MTYARKTLFEIKLIHGDYGNFIKGQKLPKDKEKKYKTPPYRDLAASNEIDGETLNEKCWPGYEKKGMKTMFGKRYPNCVKKKKTRKEEYSDWRSDFSQIDEKAVSQQQQKFFGMVRATQKGEMDNPSDEVKKAAASMTKSDVKKYASTKHDKLPKKIEEKLDSEDKPFVKKLVGKLRKGSKTHAKQADDLEKAMKENVNVKFALTPNKKSISLNYGDTTLAHRTKETYKTPTSPKAAISKALVQFRKKDDFIKKDIGEDITDEALTIQNWNVDDIKFTEIETVDIIKAKPLKESRSNWKMELDEGIKRKIIKKLAKKIAKQLGKKKPKITGDVGVKNVGQIKKYVPPTKDVVQNIQTKSIINQTKKATDLAKKPVKGTTPVKVNVSKLDIDKYFGQKAPIKKVYGTKRPTGTFKDDLPPVKRETLIKAKPGDAEKTEKLIRKYEIGDKIEKKYPGRENIKKKNKLYKRIFKDNYDWRAELGEDWQKVNRKDKTDGMSKAAVKAYRRENPGSKLKTAVTKDPKKLKKGSKSAKRRLAFCRRMKGMKKKLTSAKTSRDPDSRINKALRRWNC